MQAVHLADVDAVVGEPGGEEVTGLDFLTVLPESAEDQIEEDAATELWELD